MNFFKRLFGKGVMDQSELISVITHQFRTPLANIKWTLNAFLKGDQGTLTDEQERLLSRAYDSTERLLSFVDDILAAHKVEKGSLPPQLKSVNAYVVVENVIADLTPKAKAEDKTLTLKGNLVDIPPIKADPSQIRMIIQGLVENAITYSHEHQEIVIEVKREEGKVTISVTDKGIGIPENEQRFMYTRMFRAKNAIQKYPEGTGLGLYLAKLLTEKNSGNISFTSKEGEGTTFLLSFPIPDKI